jgi:hypothetical protein
MQFDEEIIEEETQEIIDPLTAFPNQTNILEQIAELEAADVEIHVESDQEYLERVAEIEGEPEVVQEGSDFDIDLHQSEEIILDIIKAEKNVLTEDELAHQLYGVDNDIEVSFHPAEQEIKDCIDEIVVQYTDPAGNTFEAPIVIEDLVIEEIPVQKSTGSDFDLDLDFEDSSSVDTTPDFF